MKTNWRVRETIDRLIGNIPTACKVLREEGHTNIADQIERDRENLIYWQEHGGLTPSQVAQVLLAQRRTSRHGAAANKEYKMTLIELINERLHQMFVQLAKDIATGIAGYLTPEEAAGVPLALFSAEETMRRAFRRFVTNGGEQTP